MPTSTDMLVLSIIRGDIGQRFVLPGQRIIQYYAADMFLALKTNQAFAALSDEDQPTRTTFNLY